MRKKYMKKGISILALTISILIMALLATTVIYFSNDIVKTFRNSKFAIELLNIQSTVDNYYTEYGDYPTNGTIDVSIEGFSDFEINQFAGEEIVSNIVTLSKLDLETLGITESQFGNNTKDTDVYAVSEITGKVYYIDGVIYEGETHYTLNDKLYKDSTVENVYDKAKEIRIKDLIFKVSSIQNTTEPVTMTVLVPSLATIDSITATNSVSVGTEGIEGTYKTVEINTESIVGNYDVTVVYTLEGTQSTTVYSVTNSDNIGPIINISETVNSGYTTLNLNVTDEISGVYKIKYELASISDESYFDKYGKTLTGTTINCYESGTYTIYAIDNLGNTSIVKKEVAVN